MTFRAARTVLNLSKSVNDADGLIAVIRPILGQRQTLRDPLVTIALALIRLAIGIT